MKTTINLEDELYRKLVNEALKKYGNTRSLSKIVNENIASHMKEKESGMVSERSEDEEIKRRLGIVRRSAGSWKIRETGAEYVRKIRRDSEKKLKRMGL